MKTLRRDRKKRKREDGNLRYSTAADEGGDEFREHIASACLGLLATLGPLALLASFLSTSGLLSASLGSCGLAATTTTITTLLTTEGVLLKVANGVEQAVALGARRRYFGG